MSNNNPILDAIDAGDKYALVELLLAERGITEPTIDDVHRAIASIDSIIILDGSNSANASAG